MFLASTGENVFQLIVVIAIFFGVLVLAYYSTKWIAGYQKAMNVGKNFEIIEMQKVAGNHYVMLLRAGSGGKYLIVGIGKEEMTLLGELSPDEVTISEPSTMETYGVKDSFKEMLNRFMSDKDVK